MKNKIIIDGFWNTGKLTIAKIFEQKYNYTIIDEPDHLKESIQVKDVNAWYVKQHQKNHNMLYDFSDKQGVIMKRSILSSMAFLYASEMDIEMTHGIFNKFRNWYARNDSMVVVLYFSEDKLKNVAQNIENNAIKKMLSDKKFFKRYDYFYRVVLPFQYNIAPLFINIFNKDEKTRKKTDEIIANINKAFEQDRIAQVNVVCFKMFENKPKFFIMKRNEQKGGFWQTITGGVHSKDLLGENALREVNEEVGIKVNKVDLVPTEYTFNYIGGEGYELNEYVYGYKLQDFDKITLSSEHVEFAILGRDEAIERVKYYGNKIAIKEVYRTMMIEKW